MSNGSVGKLIVLHSGNAAPEDSFNIVIVGDGYQAKELPTFQEDAKIVTQEIVGKFPVDSRSTDLPLWIARIDVTSTDSTATHPTLKGILTYFSAHFDIVSERNVLWVDECTVYNVVQTKMPTGCYAHKIVVIVNLRAVTAGGGKSLQTGGQPYGIAVAASANRDFTMVHELGHAFGLSDEYENGPIMGGAPPNIATALDSLPWEAMVTAGVTLPTPTEDHQSVGAYTIQEDRYRAQYDCIMRASSYLVDYCKVCANSIRKQLTPRSSNIDTVTFTNEERTEMSSLPAQSRHALEEPAIITCGTKDTPPCPPGDLFAETRRLLIEELRGEDDPSNERIQTITEMVDSLLISTLASTLALVQGVKNAPK